MADAVGRVRQLRAHLCQAEVDTVDTMGVDESLVRGVDEYLLAPQVAQRTHTSTHTKYINMERTYIMIKPDGVQRGLIHKVIERFEQRGFYLKAMNLLTRYKETKMENEQLKVLLKKEQDDHRKAKEDINHVS